MYHLKYFKLCKNKLNQTKNFLIVYNLYLIKVKKYYDIITKQTNLISNYINILFYIVFLKTALFTIKIAHNFFYQNRTYRANRMNRS